MRQVPWWFTPGKRGGNQNGRVIYQLLYPPKKSKMTMEKGQFYDELSIENGDFPMSC